MEIRIEKGSGRSQCRWGCNYKVLIKKDEHCLRIHGHHAGGIFTFFVCEKHAPEVFKRVRETEDKFYDLVSKKKAKKK